MFSYQQCYEYLRTASSSYTGKLHRTAVPGRSSTLSVIDSSGAIKNTVSSDVWLWSNFLISNKSTFVINLTNNFVVLSRDSNNRQKVFFFLSILLRTEFRFMYEVFTANRNSFAIKSPPRRGDDETLQKTVESNLQEFPDFEVRRTERNSNSTRSLHDAQLTSWNERWKCHKM